MTLKQLLFYLASLLPGSLFAQPPADSSLVLYLPFHAGSRDESQWHNVVIAHHATYGSDRLGQAGEAFYCNGADAFLEIPTPRSGSGVLDLPGSFTVSLWLKEDEPMTVNAEQTFLWRGHDVIWPVFRLSGNGVGLVFWSSTEKTEPPVVLSCMHIFNPARWDHFTVCVDEAKGEGRLYINGRLWVTNKMAYRRRSPCELPIIVGGLVAGETTTEMWKGWIDDLRLYNRALSTAEVAALTEGYAFPSNASAYEKTDHLDPGRYILTPVTPQDSILYIPRLLLVSDQEPVWKKSWFILLLIAATTAFSLLGAWFFYRQHQLEQSLEFEKIRALEAERFRIAREMHEDIGTGLGALQLLTDMALHKNLDPGLAAEIEYIAKSGQKVSERIREIVWTIDMRHDTLEHLVVYFQQYATDYCHHARLELNIAQPPYLPAALLPANTRRMAFLAFKEALHNIVKHAHATQVDINFSVTPKRLGIRIRDNGRGFDPATVGDAGNGLINMQKRMEEIGGKFHIESGETGTTVVFQVGS